MKGRPVLACVFTPRQDEFFTAATGEGASLNGAPLVMADPASLEGAHIAGNRKALASLAHLGIDADPSGSLPLQLRLAHVAAGRLDGLGGFEAAMPQRPRTPRRLLN